MDSNITNMSITIFNYDEGLIYARNLLTKFL